MRAAWDECWTDVSARTSLVIPAGKSSQIGNGWMKKIPQYRLQAAWGVGPAGQEENKTSWAAI